MDEIVRNTDPHFWDEPRTWCNCMAFALNLQGWYIPYQSEFTRTEKIIEEYDCHMNLREIANVLAIEDIEYMQSKFDKFKVISWAEMELLPLIMTKALMILILTFTSRYGATVYGTRNAAMVLLSHANYFHLITGCSLIDSLMKMASTHLKKMKTH